MHLCWPTHLSTHPSMYLPIHLSANKSIYHLSTYQTIYWPIYLSLSLWMHLPINLSTICLLTHLSTNLSSFQSTIYLPINLSTHLSTHLSNVQSIYHLSTCPSIYQSIHLYTHLCFCVFNSSFFSLFSGRSSSYRLWISSFVYFGLFDLLVIFTYLCSSEKSFLLYLLFCSANKISESPESVGTLTYWQTDSFVFCLTSLSTASSSLQMLIVCPWYSTFSQWRTWWCTQLQTSSVSTT